MQRVLLVWLAVAGTAAAEEWPMWRGPRLDGSSLEKGVPVRWSPGDNVAWKTPIPGIGHSSPVIHGDFLFVTSCLLKEKERWLFCLDRKGGKVLWSRKVLASPLEPKHKLNSFASSTPATDGERVWVTFLETRPRTKEDVLPKFTDGSWNKRDIFCEMVVVCYRASDGEELWRKKPGPFFSRHGFSSAPILYKDLVIINGDQDADGFVTALDQMSGAEKWRIVRPNRTRSYCVPLIADAAGRTQMVMTGSMCTASYDPDTGKEIWRVKGPTEQFVASPVYGSGLFLLTAGFPTYHNMGIRPDGIGEVTKTHVAWHEKETAARKASYVPSPIVYKDWYYVVSDLGYLSCLEAATGKRLWIEQLGRHHSASPVLVEDRLYLTDDDGITYVLRAGPTFEVLARNPLGEPCYASPAVSRGRLFLRTDHHVWCLGN